MPCSSSALISVASVKRGGGSVKCWVGVTSRDARDVALGERRQRALRLLGGVVVLALGVDPGEAVEQRPRRRRAQAVVGPPTSSTVVVSSSLGAICDAIARCQISR